MNANPTSPRFLAHDASLTSNPSNEITSSSKATRWTAHIIKALVVLFLIFDGSAKIFKVKQVLEASAQLGLPLNLIPVIGFIVLACTLVYVFPKTSILGAVLLTGFLGGAISIQLRAGNSFFESVAFPVVFGVMVWAPLFLREARLRSLIPLRR